MCLINELARYNKIQQQYRLTDEAGPAHKKTFTGKKFIKSVEIDLEVHQKFDDKSTKYRQKIDAKSTKYFFKSKLYQNKIENAFQCMTASSST